MPKQPSILKVLLSLIAFVLFMVVLLTAIGSAVGTVELLIWLAILAAGIVLIVRRYLSARSGPHQQGV